MSQQVEGALANLGRTEDLRLSPAEDRLAIAGFIKNKILLIDIAYSPNDEFVDLTDCTEITHPSLNSPHGLTWIDDTHIAVANREGQISILALQESRKAGDRVRASLLSSITRQDFEDLHSPGSVAIVPLGPKLYQLIACNNYNNIVSSHILDAGQNFRAISNELLLHEGLEVPDGVSVNHSATWIAVSNHNTNEVYLYENNGELNSRSKPDGKLLGVGVPHGLRFTANAKAILVADAGSQDVRIFHSETGQWFGDFAPAASIQVVDNESFALGHYNELEGGAKGLELCSERPLMFVTCEHVLLSIFKIDSHIGVSTDLSGVDILNSPSWASSDLTTMSLARALHASSERERTQRAAQLIQHHSHVMFLEQRLSAVKNSTSWRVTKPFRQLKQALLRK